MTTFEQIITREDLALFVNACFVSTGQKEFYSSAAEQSLSLEFLHSYICTHYRRLYTRTLAVGVNHYARIEIVRHLLSSGKLCPADFRAEEGQLIKAALRSLPPQRVWKLFERLRKDGVNNRRTRATVREYILKHKELPFQAIKYRHKLRSSLMHAHLHLDEELSSFLFESGFKKSVKFENPLLETFRAAHYSMEKVYELPYSIAEGLAAKHNIPRERFLKRIEPRMTEREKLRLQSSSGGKIALDPAKLELTELCVYLLSLTFDERIKDRVQLEGWLEVATRKVARSLEGLKLEGKVAAVLDNSFSSSGSSEKKNRPLALAYSIHRLLKGAGADYQAFWTAPMPDELLLHAKGQSNLSERFLDALDWGAETVIIVSDAAENDPSSAFKAILRGYRQIGGKAAVLHLNPFFDSQNLKVASLSPDLPALGLRSSEDLPALLGFAPFFSGESTLPELEDYLGARAGRLLETLARDLTEEPQRIL